MKRTLFYIAAIAAAAVSCTKSQVENAPVAEEEIIYTIPVSVKADCLDTKAFYGGESGLVAQWEDTDKLVTLKGMANSNWPNAKTDNAGALDIDVESIAHEGHSASAEFHGNVATSYNGKAYWYFVYSKENTVQMSAKSEWVGTLSGTHSFTNAVKVTIPSTQTGERWEPVLFGSTNELVADEEPKTATFSVLNACLAIRLFENDKVTPTTADRIVIEPAKEGSFVCGYFEDTCKPTVNEQETQDEDPSMNGTKLVLNASKFHGDAAATIDTGNITYEPFNGNEYRFSIPAGVNMGDLKVTIYKNGVETVRTIPAKVVEAGHLRPVKIALEKAASVKVTFKGVSAVTTYSAAVDGDLDYANNLENRLKASLSAMVLVENGIITECGFVIDGEKIPVEGTNTMEEFEMFALTKEFAQGSHTMNAYVTATSIATQEPETISSDVVTFHITGLPYSHNFAGRNYDNWYSSKGNPGFENDNTGAKIAHGGTIYSPAFSFPAVTNVEISGYAYFDRSLTTRFRVVNNQYFLETSMSGNFTFPASGKCAAQFSTANNYLEMSYSGGFSTSFILKDILIEYAAQ